MGLVGDPVERKRLLGKLKSEFEGNLRVTPNADFPYTYRAEYERMTAWLDPKKRRLMLKVGDDDEVEILSALPLRGEKWYVYYQGRMEGVYDIEYLTDRGGFTVRLRPPIEHLRLLRRQLHIRGGSRALWVVENFFRDFLDSEMIHTVGMDEKDHSRGPMEIFESYFMRHFFHILNDARRRLRDLWRDKGYVVPEAHTVGDVREEIERVIKTPIVEGVFYDILSDGGYVCFTTKVINEFARGYSKFTGDKMKKVWRLREVSDLLPCRSKVVKIRPRYPIRSRARYPAPVLAVDAEWFIERFLDVYMKEWHPFAADPEDPLGCEEVVEGLERVPEDTKSFVMALPEVGETIPYDKFIEAFNEMDELVVEEIKEGFLYIDAPWVFEEARRVLKVLDEGYREALDLRGVLYELTLMEGAAGGRRGG